MPPIFLAERRKWSEGSVEGGKLSVYFPRPPIPLPRTSPPRGEDADASARSPVTHNLINRALHKFTKRALKTAS